MTDNKKIAEQVLRAVGGAANLKDATHCMTRLRLYLKDDSVPKDDEVKKISGVLGVVRGGQQYQIIIGTNVPKVYDELCKLAGISASAAVKDDAAAAQDAAITKRKLTPKQAGKNIMGYLAGCMTPMIPVLLAGGLFRAVNSIFGPDLLGLYTLESNLYILFDFLYDAAFYFMPILVGYNAAKQLGVNGMLGSFIGSVLMVPDFAAFATNGQTFTVFGIPATVTNYAQTVLPVMLSVPLFCLIYKLVKKFMPDLLTSVFTPFFSLIISMPFILCLLAPLGTIVGNAISGGLAWFGMTTGWFGVAVIAALWEFLVMSGMHLALMMPMMADFFETGIISGPMNAGNFATWACFGVALGAALRLKNKDDRSTSFAAFASGILGGVTEPTLYGICFRFTRCFVTMAVGGFVGGAIAGIFDLKGYAMTSPNFLSLLGYVGGTNANIVVGVVASFASLGHFVVGDAGAACPQIGGGNAFAAFVVTALYLKGAGRRAPEEIGGENHLFRQVDNTSLFDFMVLLRQAHRLSVGKRNRTARYSLSLRVSAGAGGRLRRLARPQDDRRLSEIRRGLLYPLQGPRQAVGHSERTAHRHRRRHHERQL